MKTNHASFGLVSLKYNVYSEYSRTEYGYEQGPDASATVATDYLAAGEVRTTRPENLTYSVGAIESGNYELRLGTLDLNDASTLVLPTASGFDTTKDISVVMIAHTRLGTAVKVDTLVELIIPDILSANKLNSGYVPVDLTWTYRLYSQANLKYFWLLHNVDDGAPWRSPVEITNISTDGNGIMTASFIVGEYNGNGSSIKMFVKNEAGKNSHDSNVMLLDVGLDSLTLDGGALLYPERKYRTGASSGSINNTALFQISTDNGVTYSEPVGMLHDDDEPGNNLTKLYMSPQLNVGTTYKIRAYYTQSGKTSPYTYANFTVENRLYSNHPDKRSEAAPFSFTIGGPDNDITISVIEGMDYVFQHSMRSVALKQYEIYKSDENGIIGEFKSSLDFRYGQTLHWAASYNAAGKGWYVMRPVKNYYGFGPEEDVDPISLYKWV